MNKLDKAEQHFRRLGALIEIIDRAKEAEDEASNIGGQLKKLLGPVIEDWSGPNDPNWLSYWDDVLGEPRESRTWDKDVDELMATLRAKANAIAKLSNKERALLGLDERGNKVEV